MTRVLLLMDVIQCPQGIGQRVQLLGVTGDQVSPEITDIVFPILTQTKNPYTLSTKGTTLVLEKSKDNILSLDALYKAGFIHLWLEHRKIPLLVEY